MCNQFHRPRAHIEGSVSPMRSPVHFLRFIVHTVDVHVLGIREFAALKDLLPPRPGKYVFKDYVSPAYIVGSQRGAALAVHGEILDRPDSVERRWRPGDHCSI